MKKKYSEAQLLDIILIDALIQDGEAGVYECWHVDEFKKLELAGYIEMTGRKLAWPDGPPRGQRQHFYYHFKATPKGVQHFVSEACREGQDSETPSFAALAGYETLISGNNTKSLYDMEIGAEIDLFSFGRGCIHGLAGVRDGYCELVSWRQEGPFARRLRVRLTRAGFDYVRTLQRPYLVA